MSTDAERREEARMEAIDDRLDREGVTCADCRHRWIPGRGCCPLCGGAIADDAGDHCEACGAPDDGTQTFCEECGECLVDEKYLPANVHPPGRSQCS